MKKQIFAAIVICFLSTAVMGQRWQSLFNGKDLTGWKQLNGNASFTVKDGEIVGTTVIKEPSSFLATTEEYEDFILEFEFKLHDSVNSGVQFRSRSSADFKNGRVHGYQFEIDPGTRAWSGGIYDEADRLWLYSVESNPAAKKAYRHKEWNHGRIECTGNTIRTWLNNIPVSYLVDSVVKKGFIALQVHSIKNPADEGKEIRFRNIRIQTEKLKPSSYTSIFIRNMVPNFLTKHEKKEGFYFLFDGKSNAQWRRIYQKKFPDKGWDIRNGTLTVQNSNGEEQGFGGDLVTRATYSAFDLQFEFKLTEGANSGVKYFVQESYDSKGKSGIGLEFQVLDDARHPDAKLGKDGNRTLGSLYDLIPRAPVAAAFKKIGEWNYGRIVVYPNNRVEHWLNGYKILEYEKGSKDFIEKVAASKYKDWPGFGLWEKGHILLQDHGNEVSYRSIKIKVLK